MPKSDEELRRIILKYVEPHMLDELIHDYKSSEASSINNEGIEAQLNYLEEALGIKGVIDGINEYELEPRIKELADGNA